MKIFLAKHSGFCMGVRSAILRIISEINKSRSDIYVYGPLIHNPQTLEALSARGLKTIFKLTSLDGKKIAVRTHGITKAENRLLKSGASRVINLTCSRVARVQAIIKKYSSQGSFTLIVGDKDHAEVSGLISYAENGYHLISDINDTDSIPDAESYIVVSQTTFDRNLFSDIIKQLPNPESTQIFDTICDSTMNRQSDVLTAIASGINTLVVVGGKNSANTARLAGIGYKNNIKTFHIETEAELQENNFNARDVVLVTAGASTPGWIINNVLEKLYNIKYKNGNIIINTLKNSLEFAVRTNLLSAIGSYFLSLLSQYIIISKTNHSIALLSFMYIFSMYSSNNYFERDILKKSNSYKYSLYSKFGIHLLVISSIFFIVSIIVTGLNNPLFYLISGAYVIGFFYSTGLAKKSIKFFNNSSISKIYNSKIVTGVGWSLVTTLVPMIHYSDYNISGVAVAAAVFAIIFTRQILLDKIAFQSDLIMGRETIPIWIGMKKTGLMLNIFFYLTTVLLLSCSFYTSNFKSAILIAPLLYYYFSAIVINRQSYVISFKYELLVDINFILIAALFGAVVILHSIPL